MTKDKIQKRAIRERMTKTGERYTTARHFHLDLQHQQAAAALDADEPGGIDLDFPELPPRVAEPGLSDETVSRATSKSWDGWFAVLDAWGASQRKHPEIARFLHDVHGTDDWWAQTITVGYERARGIRAVHERPDGFSLNASKTFPVSVDRLYHAFVDEEARSRWLDPGELRLRTSQPNRSARFDVVANETRLGAWFTPKGTGKSTVQLQHERLPTAGDVDLWRTHWQARLKRLLAFMTEDTPGGSSRHPRTAARLPIAYGLLWQLGLESGSVTHGASRVGRAPVPTVDLGRNSRPIVSRRLRAAPRNGTGPRARGGTFHCRDAGSIERAFVSAQQSVIAR
jgi:uncharacterized protein YndB with AHSA1/START domain